MAMEGNNFERDLPLANIPHQQKERKKERKKE